MTEPFLSRPSIKYQASFIAAMREFQAEGKNPPWNYGHLQSRFAEYVQMLDEKEFDPAAGFVPETYYWLIVDGQYAGRISIRHELNEKLRLHGGHIGYDIRPSLRRKGYGTIQLRLALVQARELGLQRVLLTCDDDNIASAKIIESQGGVLEDKPLYEGKITRRYWIDLG